MTLSRPTLVAFRGAVRLMTFAFVLVAVSTLAVRAQTSGTPSILFQDAGVATSTNTIDVTRVPVVNSKGTITYYDISLVFEQSGSGEPVLVSGSPVVATSAKPNSANFIAGTYIAPTGMFDNNGIITVSGPSALAGGGTEWTLTLPSGAYGETYPNSAVWYVEPIASNPLAARIQKAGLTSTQYSYGVGNTFTDHWYENSLLGFSQSGNSLTITDFTNLGNDVDQSTSADQITYILQKP